MATEEKRVFEAEDDTYIKAYTTRKALRGGKKSVSIQVRVYEDERDFVEGRIREIFREVLGPDLYQKVTLTFEEVERKPSGIVAIIH